MMNKYTKQEINNFQRYITSHISKIDQVFYELNGDTPIDIYLIKLDNLNKQVLVTSGMGIFPIDNKEETYNLELILSLPGSWDLKRNDWPIKLLRFLAYLPTQNIDNLDWGHTISLDKYLFNGSTEQNNIILLEPTYDVHLYKISDRYRIKFLEAALLYEEELDYKVKQGPQALINCFNKNNVSISPFDLNRPIVVPVAKQKNYLVNWQGPRKCIITAKAYNQKIIKSMYRIVPSNQNPWDSGWRFSVGDESEEDLGQENGVLVVDLNDICNLNKKIVRRINEPYGVAYNLNEKGSFEEAINPFYQSKPSIDINEEGLRLFLNGTKDGYRAMLHQLDLEVDSLIKSGKYTDFDIKSDVNISLLYSEGFNNIGDYEHFYMTTQIMPPALVNSLNNGLWYERYSFACLMIGKVYQALDLCIKGMEQDGNNVRLIILYTIIQTVISNYEEAIKVIAQAKSIYNDDLLIEYSNILENKGSLKELLSVYSDIDFIDYEDMVKNILVKENNLKLLEDVLNVDSWLEESPYLLSKRMIKDYLVEIIFKMNKAYFSYFTVNQLQLILKTIDNSKLLHYNKDVNEEGLLKRIFVSKELDLTLVYYHEQSNQTWVVELDILGNFKQVV